MASPGYARILYIAILIPIIVQSNQQVSRRDLSSLISSVLNHKSSGNKRPIVVILNSGSKRDRSVNSKLLGDESSDENGAIHVPHIYLQKQRAKTRSPIKRTTKSLLQLKQRDRQLDRLQRLRVDENVQRDDKNALRSPIIKKLLRISNRLQCDAKDDCEDKCNNIFKGKKVITCQIKCEEKYDCEEEKEKEKDDCGENCVDSCGEDVKCLMMSTKGAIIEPEDNKCKRC